MEAQQNGMARGSSKHTYTPDKAPSLPISTILPSYFFHKYPGRWDYGKAMAYRKHQEYSGNSATDGKSLQ